MVVTAWIQRPDLSADELGSVSLDDALSMVQARAWDKELSELERLEARQADSCPPGTGFVVAGGGPILHVGAVSSQFAYCHYHFTTNARWLGIFPYRRDETVSDIEVPWSAVPELIRRFYTGDHEYLRHRNWRAA